MYVQSWLGQSLVENFGNMHHNFFMECTYIHNYAYFAYSDHNLLTYRVRKFANCPQLRVCRCILAASPKTTLVHFGALYKQAMSLSHSVTPMSKGTIKWQHLKRGRQEKEVTRRLKS